MLFCQLDTQNLAHVRGTRSLCQLGTRSQSTRNGDLTWSKNKSKSIKKILCSTESRRSKNKQANLFSDRVMT